MSYSKLILRDSAEIVWSLDDITESSSISKPINFFTENSNSYSASINTANTNLLYNPIVFGGGTALSFTSSAVGLSIPVLGRFSELYSNKESTLSIWLQANNLSVKEQPIFKKRNHPNIGLFIQNNYLIFRYGTSASYTEVAADLVDLSEPNHIIVSKSESALNLIVNGIAYSSINPISLTIDSQHSNNDYLDFYGPINGSWNIDSISIYPNYLTGDIAKRHYVYGLGKTVSDTVFYSRGGNLYNMSTISTERMIDLNWDYKDEWKLKEIIDLSLEDDGIKPISYSNPVFYSYDNYLNKNSDLLSFHSSASNTQASYIEIDKLYNKIGGGQYPLFLKIKLDGQLPDQYLSHRLMSYGKLPDNEILKFDLYNNGGIYQVRVNVIDSSSVAFNISNITASPSIYVGMKFSGFTTLFFAESGSAVQSASFSYFSASVSGVDPLVPYFPPAADTVLRIGSSLNYDNNTFTDVVYGVEQFYGSFEKFMVLQEDFTASVNYNYLDAFRKSRYQFVYSTDKNRFKIKTYGYGNFILHSAKFAEYITDDIQKIGANVVRFGYPDVSSASQVYFYVTQTNYSGSVVYPKTSISQNNYLNFLNNTNVNSTYLTFDFEIYADDAIYYPPKIKYFQMQTFKSTNNTTIMRDDAGPNFTLYPTSSVVYLPDIRYTPTIFMTEDSGIKLSQTIADFSERIASKPLDPRTISGLKLWLDARFVNGLGITIPDDDSRVTKWTDLSDNNNHAIQNISASAPVFRTQSLNLLRNNQLSGSDNTDLTFVTGINSSIELSVDGAIKGEKGFKSIPSGSSIDSYIDLTYNTASLSTFSNQSYTMVGSIKLDKPQTGSALHSNARKIVIYNSDGITETFSASSYAAANTKGIYSLSATFVTSSATVQSIFRFYNGSFDSKDPVYWDGLAVYPITAGSAIYSWTAPLTDNDRMTIKFKDNLFLESTASSLYPNSLYIIARNFEDSIFLQSPTASILYSNSASYFISYGSPQNYSVSDNKFKLFSILNNGTSASVFINGEFTGTKNTGNLNITKLFIGRKLKGDISALLLFDNINSINDRHKVEKWLSQSFDIPYFEV